MTLESLLNNFSSSNIIKELSLRSKREERLVLSGANKTVHTFFEQKKWNK